MNTLLNSNLKNSFISIIGFYFKDTDEPDSKKPLFYTRKNGKTSFVGGLAFALSIVEAASGATLYIVAAAQKQAQQSFDFIHHSLRAKGFDKQFRVRNNNAEHSIHYEFAGSDGKPKGTIHIEALASNPDAQDSFNCNVAIADEIHAFKKASQYNRFKRTKSLYKKLMIGITTAR